MDENTHLQFSHVLVMKYMTDTKAKSILKTAAFGGDEVLSFLDLTRQWKVNLQARFYRVHQLWNDLYLRYLVELE